MRETLKVDTQDLSLRDLRVLLANARAAGRDALAERIVRELARRGQGGPERRPERRFPRLSPRRAGGYTAAALAAVLSAGAVFWARDLLPSAGPPDAAAPAGPRAAMARLTKPVPETPLARRAPTPAAAPRSTEVADAAAPIAPRKAAAPWSILPETPESAPRELAALTPPRPVALAASDAGALAVSRSGPGVGRGCEALADPAEQMVCEDARRAAGGRRSNRITGGPVRVTVTRGVGGQSASILSPP